MGVRSRSGIALLLVTVMISAPLGGCLFTEEEASADASSLSVTPEVLEAGVFQSVELKAKAGMSVYIPYLVRDPMTGFIQNSTVVDLSSGSTSTIEMLAPPRTDSVMLLVGEKGRDHWPIREVDESWTTWLMRGGDAAKDGNGAERVPHSENASLDTINHSIDNGGRVSVKTVNTIRGQTVSIEQGGAHSSGLLHGRLVYERLYEISDPSLAVDVDGRAGYWDRWAGQGNPCLLYTSPSPRD